MNPRLLYFGKTEFNSDIRSLPHNPSGRLFNSFPWSELKHLLLCPFHVIMALGMCTRIRATTRAHTCLTEKVEIFYEVEIIMPPPAHPSLQHTPFLWLWHALSLVWNQRHCLSMLCLLEAFLVAAYSHFPSVLMGRSGKCTDSVAGEVIWMSFAVCS